jgi:hypothetical protein
MPKQQAWHEKSEEDAEKLCRMSGFSKRALSMLFHEFGFSGLW